MVVLSAGTDGSDGPTDAAGAIADGRTLARNPRAPDFLARNDSYRYFESLGDLIVTGPTEHQRDGCAADPGGRTAVSFWRKEVIDFALDRETAAHIREQKEWIAREPHNPRPWYNLAQLYRMEQKQDEALALLLEAVRLDDACADAHVALDRDLRGARGLRRGATARAEGGGAWQSARSGVAAPARGGVSTASWMPIRPCGRRFQRTFSTAYSRPNTGPINRRYESQIQGWFPGGTRRSRPG